jgi:hypothetical protein
MNRGLIGLIVVSKIFRAISAYLSIIIAKNMTTNVYLEKVLLNGENPPAISNQLMLGVLFETAMTIVLCIVLYVGVGPMALLSGVKSSAVTDHIITDAVIYLIIFSVIGYIIASVMYNKKYFLYKDDGMRAIRAFAEIASSISLFLTCVPFNLIPAGGVSLFRS